MTVPFLAAAVTAGGAWPCNDGKAELGDAIILSAEDDAADTIVPRLLAAGADTNRVHIVSAVRGDDGKGHRLFNLQADLGLLEETVRKVGTVRLVVIDPISSYLGRGIESHNNTDVRGVLEPVSEIASRLRVAVVAVSHFNKNSSAT